MAGRKPPNSPEIRESGIFFIFFPFYSVANRRLLLLDIPRSPQISHRRQRALRFTFQSAQSAQWTWHSTLLGRRKTALFSTRRCNNKPPEVTTETLRDLFHRHIWRRLSATPSEKRLSPIKRRLMTSVDNGLFRKWTATSKKGHLIMQISSNVSTL